MNKRTEQEMAEYLEIRFGHNCLELAEVIKGQTLEVISKPKEYLAALKYWNEVIRILKQKLK